MLEAEVPKFSPNFQNGLQYTRRANKLLMDSFLKTIKPTLTSLFKGLHNNFKD